MSVLSLGKGVSINLNLAFSSKGIPICETRVVRGGKGMPWNNRIAIHPRSDGIELMEVKTKELPKRTVLP